MTTGPDDVSLARARITQIFEFLKAFHELRNPVCRRVDDQPWHLWLKGLPQHPSVRLKPATPPEETAAILPEGDLPLTDVPILRVRRPQLTDPPRPPADIEEWLVPGSNDFPGVIGVRPSINRANADGHDVVEWFDENSKRRNALDAWTSRREAWQRQEAPARAVYRLFEDLYALHGRLEREEEQIELLLGDGILNLRQSTGDIEHPVLVQRVELEFDPQIPEFSIQAADSPVELYSSLLLGLPDMTGAATAACTDELRASPVDLTDWDSAAPFLRRLALTLSARGEVLERGRPQGVQDHARVGHDPVLFLRARTAGVLSALEDVLRALPSATELPLSLVRIAGVEAAPAADLPDGAGNAASAAIPTTANEDESVLFSKPANREQLAIAKRLETQGAVLVQGPPGTGKTHTIANLIGQLLAEGQSVLVTSHTSKALRMVREQVVDILRPLCVSLLERDSAGKEQLAESVRAIVGRTSTDLVALDAQARDLKNQRLRVLESLRGARKELLDSRNDEYRPIVLDGTSYDPSEAARQIAQNAARDSWIPGPVKAGAALPVSLDEVADLYATAALLDRRTENEIAAGLPALADLLSTSEFERIAPAWAQLATRNKAPRDPEGAASDEAAVVDIDLLIAEARRAAEPLATKEPWKLDALLAGIQGGAHLGPWETLLKDIDSLAVESTASREIILRYAPHLASDEPVGAQADTFEEIFGFLEKGGKINWLSRRTHGNWEKLIAKVSVGNQAPVHSAHFRALASAARTADDRGKVCSLWDRFVTPLGLPPAKDMGTEPETAMSQYSAVIRDLLDWRRKEFEPLQASVQSHGVSWDDALKRVAPDMNRYGVVERTRLALVGPLPEALAKQRGERVHALERSDRDGLLSTLDQYGGSKSKSATVTSLYAAVAGCDIGGYTNAYNRLTELLRLTEPFETKHRLLATLGAVAPGWSAAIRTGTGPHHAGSPPGDVSSAWLWRQLDDELTRRGSVSLDEIQGRIESLTAELRQITTELIEALAWAAQVRRTSLRQRQALVGWLQVTNNRVGKGTGRHAEHYRQEAKKLLATAEDAVPVWIMPLARVIENFRPGHSQFDVLIIDEASQLDLMGLIALFMAKKVIVVGDNEQVSPDAVGIDMVQVLRLQEQYLDGVPNAGSYDGQTSIYDLALQSFGSVIRLVEHFRSVADIIQFSNQLSYNLEIRPLRDESAVTLKPHMIAHHLTSSGSDERLNKDEALEVASLMAAAIEQPEFVRPDGTALSMGMISLVGIEQAIEVDLLLTSHLAPVLYQRHRIVCGNAAQFQGDERDVMFLSMVDAPSGSKVLPIRTEGANNMFKRRFNVASSRARDQMWVVHSLDPEKDLQAGDIRRRLIQHAQDPGALLKLSLPSGPQQRSRFEDLVLRRLSTKGYRVTSHWKAGAYTIDLVVEGGGRRLAIVCDGDRSTPLEKLAEDLERQMVLERLGWRFMRIRGSKFFRDPDAAVQTVLERLQTTGVIPEGQASPTAASGGDAPDVRTRIEQRAAEIRAEWGPPKESVPGGRTPRRYGHSA